MPPQPVWSKETERIRKRFRAPDLDAFLNEAGYRKMRVIYSAQGLITFETTLPPTYDKICVLDASAPIKALLRADKSVEACPWIGKNGNLFDGRIAQYPSLEIQARRANAGRNSIERATDSENRVIFRKVARVIAEEIPQDEAVICFTFKTRNAAADPTAALRSTLAGYGVKLNETIKTYPRGPQGPCVRRPRIVFLTWGNELGLSHFSYATNVILCGILERSAWDLSAEYAARTDDLLAEINRPLIQEILFSDVAYRVHQALGRGSMRTVVNGIARPMKAWLWFRNPRALQAILSEGPDAVLPGARWSFKAEGIIEEGGEKMRAVLDAVKAEGKECRLRITDWKQRAGVTDLAPQTAVECRDYALEGSGWRLLSREQAVELEPVSAEGHPATLIDSSIATTAQENPLYVSPNLPRTLV